MAFFEILEYLLGALALVILITQCFIPEIGGRPWFPLFRRKYRLQAEEMELTEQMDEEQLLKKLKEMREKNNGIRNAEPAGPNGETGTERKTAVPPGTVGNPGDHSDLRGNK